MADESSDAPAAPENPPKKGAMKRLHTYLCVTTPKAAYFLLANVFCEMTYAYGVFTIYIMYLQEEIRLTREWAKFILHFSMFANFIFPIIGAFLGDMYVKKIWLIVISDWLAMLRGVIFALSSYFFDSTIQLFILLGLLIGGKVIGIGGPAVVAFPGDQYNEDQTEGRDTYYHAYYFCLNFGAFLGHIITPELRTGIQCIPNKETCYPAAFGGSVCISLLGTAFLLGGWTFYKFLPPQKKYNWNFFKCLWYALRRRIALVFGGLKKCSLKDCKHNRDHWLDLADDKYDADTIVGMKGLWNATVIFTAYPMFWALFEQMPTMWTLMSTKLDGRTPFWLIKPDQMDFFNPFLVMLLILIFKIVIYPLCEKVRFIRKPLERVGYGFALAVISYIIGGIVCIFVEKAAPTYPAMDLLDVAFHNGLPCDVNVQLGNEDLIPLKGYESAQLKDLKVEENMSGTLKLPEQNCSLGEIPEFNFKLNVEGGFAYSVLFVNNGSNITVQQARQNRTRDDQSNAPKIRFVYVGPDVGSRQLYLGSPGLANCVPLSNMLLECSGEDCPEYITETSNMHRETEICYWSQEHEECACDAKIGSYTFVRGGIYDVMIVEDNDGVSSSYVFETAEPDSVPILFQFPMYFLITSGEIMASITGYTFAYGESPPTATSFLMAVFYVSVSFGSLVVIVIDKLIEAIHGLIETTDYMRPQQLPRLSTYFFVYAGFMFLDLLYFVFLARRHSYVNPVYQAIK